MACHVEVVPSPVPPFLFLCIPLPTLKTPLPRPLYHALDQEFLRLQRLTHTDVVHGRGYGSGRGSRYWFPAAADMRRL